MTSARRAASVPSCAPTAAARLGAGWLFAASFAVLLTVSSTVSSGLAGCGGGQQVDDDASVTGDASALPDAGDDPDRDEDGYPASEDCNDYDPGIYPGTRTPCQSDCDFGKQVCLADGTFGACSAREDCDCDSAGDTRVIGCGNCGSASQECGLDLVWSYPGDCFDEGECAPGTVEEGDCELCGTASRLCNDQCAWLPWEGCFGVCEPGTQQVDQTGCTEPWEHRLTECTAQCEWEEAQPCGGDCLLTARTGTSDFKDEVCVPGSELIMGADPGEGQYPDEQPEHVVGLSPYYIDVYEVTVARYRECVTAGACTAPSVGTYHETNSDDLPVDYVTWFQAVDFCAWDGGRRLPTEAEWEKAARGPAPREVTEPWGNDAATCSHVPARDCLTDPWDPLPVAVDANPDGASFYGLHQMGGNVSEWISDWYQDDYYAISPPVDPQGPTSGSDRVVRGYNCTRSLTDYSDSLTCRGSEAPDRSYVIGFRCARAGN